MKPFIKYIAYLQIIGIILVVFGHSFHEYPDGTKGKSLLLYRMLYSFRMPLFMFVSGFLMVFTTRLRKASCRPGVTAFVKTKLRRLMLPFAFLSMVTFIPRAVMSGFADDVMALNMESFLRSFFYTDALVIPYFWFLQASFVLLVFCYAAIVAGERAGIGNTALYAGLVGLFVALQFVPVGFGSFFSLGEAVRLGPYFALGAAYSQFAVAVDRRVPWTHPFFFSALVAVWAGLFFLTEGSCWMLFCSVAGIAMSIALAKLMERHGITLLDHLVGSNYMIFLLSWYCNVASQQVLSHFVEWPWWGYTVLSLVSGIYIPWLCYRYLQRHAEIRWVRGAALLLGQSFKPRRKN